MMITAELLVELKKAANPEPLYEHQADGSVLIVTYPKEEGGWLAVHQLADARIRYNLLRSNFSRSTARTMVYINIVRRATGGYISPPEPSLTPAPPEERRTREGHRRGSFDHQIFKEKGDDVYTLTWKYQFLIDGKWVTKNCLRIVNIGEARRWAIRWKVGIPGVRVRANRKRRRR